MQRCLSGSNSKKCVVVITTILLYLNFILSENQRLVSHCHKKMVLNNIKRIKASRAKVGQHKSKTDQKLISYLKSSERFLNQRPNAWLLCVTCLFRRNPLRNQTSLFQALGHNPFVARKPVSDYKYRVIRVSLQS